MSEVNNPIIIVPYIIEQEIKELKDAIGWKLECEFWEDKGRIGSDLAYQYLWNKHRDRDVIILHSDMLPMPEDKNHKWFQELLETVEKYPEAGMFGMKLLYPQKINNKYIIQHAGGRFDKNGEALHFGGGLNLFDGSTNGPLEEDEGQYDKIREVAWITMGGIYIKKDVRDSVGNFDPAFYWTYFRDVDYCLSARRAGFKIYQTGIPFMHFESKDNKRLMAQNPALQEKWSINREVFKEKWTDSEFYNTLDEEVQ